VGVDWRCVEAAIEGATPVATRPHQTAFPFLIEIRERNAHTVLRPLDWQKEGFKKHEDLFL